MPRLETYFSFLFEKRGGWNLLEKKRKEKKFERPLSCLARNCLLVVENYRNPASHAFLQQGVHPSRFLRQLWLLLRELRISCCISLWRRCCGEMRRVGRAASSSVWWKWAFQFNFFILCHLSNVHKFVSHAYRTENSAYKLLWMLFSCPRICGLTFVKGSRGCSKRVSITFSLFDYFFSFYMLLFMLFLLKIVRTTYWECISVPWRPSVAIWQAPFWPLVSFSTSRTPTSSMAASAGELPSYSNNFANKNHPILFRRKFLYFAERTRMLLWASLRLSRSVRRMEADNSSRQRIFPIRCLWSTFSFYLQIWHFFSDFLIKKTKCSSFLSTELWFFWLSFFLFAEERHSSSTRTSPRLRGEEAIRNQWSPREGKGEATKEAIIPLSIVVHFVHNPFISAPYCSVLRLFESHFS